MTLLKRLSSLKGESHHLIFSLVLTITSLHYATMVILLILYLGFLWFKDYCIAIIAIGLIAVFVFRHEAQATLIIEENSYKGHVRYVLNADRFVMNVASGRLLVHVEDAPTVKAGDTITVHGTMRTKTPPMLPHAFDYDRYLTSKGIDAIFFADDIVIHNQGFSIYQLRDRLDHYITERFDDAAPYLRTFVLADRNELDETTLKGASNLGIAHLFAVSGLHISLLALMILGGFKKFKIDTSIAETVLVVLLGLYVIITVFSPSVLRAASMAGFLILNKRLKAGFTAVDICALLCVVLLVINPLYYVQTGFILTFLVAFTLMMSSHLLETGSFIKRMLKVSVLAFFTTLPIIANFNYGVNPFTILFNVVFVAYTMFLLLPGGYLTLVIPFLEPLYTFIIRIFETAVHTLNTFLNITIRLYFNHPMLILSYFVIWFMTLRHVRTNKKYQWIGLLALFIFFIHIMPFINYKQRVIFFHVHGDSILISDRFNRCNILIDTGEADSFDTLAHTLRRLHITHLDYLIISHDHSDHNGAYDSVIQAIPTHRTITNDTQAHVENRTIYCGDIALFIYPLESAHQSENNRSMVKTIIVSDTVYLFTGDIEASRERTLNLNDIKIDILKVPHHGSRTSSTQAFLDMTRPEEAIISAHQNNRFNHPHDLVIQRLETMGVTVHRTDKEGTIHFEHYFSKRVKKSTLYP